jgi:hypothetical protein
MNKKNDKQNISIILRCSNDLRVFDCLDSIDVVCDIVVAMTPNQEIQEELELRNVRYVLSPVGNPAKTTLSALPHLKFQNVLLVDSDCVFKRGAISRLIELFKDADIVRPRIYFVHNDFSSYLTHLCREYVNTYNDFVYEPGLLIDLTTVLPEIGGYLFSELAPFTPDGEFDYRLRQQSKLRITVDNEISLEHDALSFSKHIYSNWRYGCSDAARQQLLGQQTLKFYFKGMPRRTIKAFSYPIGTFPLVLINDLVYFAALLWNLLKGKLKADSKYR